LKKKELIDDIEKKASIGFRHGQNRSHRISNCPQLVWVESFWSFWEGGLEN
jgi:hypothetical protein